jgi:hypothetical protein
VIAGVGMARVKQKGKGRIGFERTERTKPQKTPQSEAEETTRGWKGGLEGLWGGALQGCARPGRRVSNEGDKVAVGRLHQRTSQGTRR